MISCTNSEVYVPGQNVMALSFFAPEFQAGSVGRIINRERGRLLAVKTPSGEILKWFTIFELESVNPEVKILLEGNYAIVTTTRLGPKTLEKGTVVQIVKRIDSIDYYEVGVSNFPERYRVTGIDVTRIPV